MNQDEKLDEALKGTFPASDPFYLSPENASVAGDEGDPPAPPAYSTKNNGLIQD